MATKIYETKITTSYGDMIDSYWQFQGFDISPDDDIVLTIKKSEDDKESILRKVFKMGSEDNFLRILISSDEMEVLEKGRYKYDLVRVRMVDGKPQRITLIYPSDFIVVGVVHDE